MHRGHPLLCGTLLGLTWTLLSLLFQGADWLAAWSLEREGAALLGMTAVGALIAAVPKLLRNRGSYWARESALGCAGAFLCGVGMMMGLHLAGSGRIVSAMLEGSTGAYGFVFLAWIAGGVTAQLEGRRSA